MEPTIKFDVPPAVRSFAPFSRLPVEIRHQIWEESIFEPGMHFLYLKTKAPIRHVQPPVVPNPDNIDDEDNDDAMIDLSQEKTPAKLWSATLQPKYPSVQADISKYVALHRELANMSATCSEAAAVVRRVMERPGGLRLNGDRLITLASSTDIVCLEYLSPDNFSSGCRVALDIECPELANIRHVAVPYCHAWESTRPSYRCTQCGNHHAGSAKKVYPLHLYEFLARYLPNLETFYFIDYLILRLDRGADVNSGILCPKHLPPHNTPTGDKALKVDAFEKPIRNESSGSELPDKRKNLNISCRSRENDRKEQDPTVVARSPTNSKHSSTAPKSTVDVNDAAKVLRRGFKSTGRVFWDVEEKDWYVKSGVFDTISWLQKRFVQYATGSKLSTHTRPEAVEFKVLACEWVEREAGISLKRACTGPKKPLNKRMRPSLQKEAGQTKAVLTKSSLSPPALSTSSSPPSSSLPLRCKLEDKFVFVFGDKKDWHFKFSQEFRP
ncbi:hypothetical protein CCHL11_03726 [Colletotrichum chlorophyti]|uniref:2EXR domain-containing protein n=1 Tax=Colletotrichum chlorophyti TaxID=708187 RepID=A0A1Q8RQY1_9PEZI|nr:hypothetical protein CCHL11_03726 [Colletotrichum chlorophyti]